MLVCRMLVNISRYWTDLWSDIITYYYTSCIKKCVGITFILVSLSLFTILVFTKENAKKDK